MASCSSSFKRGILSILLIFPSLFHLCLSDGDSGGAATANLDQLLDNVGSQVQNLKDAQGQAQCMQKLLPCQPFLKSPINPPPVCCNPLSEMAKNATDCLCTFFNDPKTLSTFNLSKDDIMKLPSACGVDVDASKCSSSNNNNNSGAISVGEDKKDSSNSTRMTSPYGITLSGVPGFVAMLIVLVFSAY